jgi:hypothetical protein
MTSTRQSCDFCGATIRATDRHATVTIPLTDDERQLHARVRRDELTAAERRSGGYLPWPFALIDAAQADRVFDMCLGCAQGLVRARLATVKAMREAWR